MPKRAVLLHNQRALKTDFSDNHFHINWPKSRKSRSIYRAAVPVLSIAGNENVFYFTGYFATTNQLNSTRSGYFRV